MQIIITLCNELQLTYIPWFNNQNLARRSPINFYIFIELCTKTHHDRIYGNQKISTYKSTIWKWFSTKQKKNRWTQNIQPAHNLQIKNRIDLYYVFNSYLKIWDSRYFLQTLYQGRQMQGFWLLKTILTKQIQKFWYYQPPSYFQLLLLQKKTHHIYRYLQGYCKKWKSFFHKCMLSANFGCSWPVLNT